MRKKGKLGSYCDINDYDDDDDDDDDMMNVWKLSQTKIDLR